MRLLPVRGTIRLRLVLWGLFVPIPLVALLFVQHFYAISVVRHQVADSNQNLLSLYTGRIDQNLRYVDEFLISFAAQDTDVSSLDTFQNPTDNVLARIRISNALAEYLPRYRMIDSLFVYSRRSNTFIESNAAGRSYEDRERFRQYVRSVTNESARAHTGASPASAQWRVVKIGTSYLIIRVLRLGNVSVGALTDARKILSPLTLLHLGSKGASLLVDRRGQLIVGSPVARTDRVDFKRGFAHPYLTGNPTRYLVIGQPSSEGDFSLVALIPDRAILQNLPYFERFMTPMAILSIAVIPIGLLFLRRSVLEPLGKIVEAMERVQQGELDRKIEPNRATDELAVVNSTFNRMVERIRKLKIDVYEEQLAKQKAEMQYLQLQIKPHFFLNALNILYQLAEVRKYGLIQELALSLVNHFRYMFKSNSTLVTLREELDHVRNYRRIHEARFPKGHDCAFDIAEDLLDVQVPPLVIQTFVENALKHGGHDQKHIHIDIRAQAIDDARGKSLLIVIADSGPGFSAEHLETLRTGDSSPDEAGEHIGIANVRQRLAVLYHGTADIQFSNHTPHGATVEIRFPIGNQQADLTEISSKP